MNKETENKEEFTITIVVQKIKIRKEQQLTLQITMATYTNRYDRNETNGRMKNLEWSAEEELQRRRTELDFQIHGYIQQGCVVIIVIIFQLTNRLGSYHTSTGNTQIKVALFFYYCFLLFPLCFYSGLFHKFNYHLAITSKFFVALKVVYISDQLYFKLVLSSLKIYTDYHLHMISQEEM